MKIEEIKLYLPKYLSSDAEKELFSGLKDFPGNLDERIYTTFLKKEEVIFQGDGIKKMIIVNLPSTDSKKCDCIVLSNTCDIDLKNKRNFPSQIVYAPIIKLEDYINVTLASTSKSSDQIESHIEAIKKQKVTQIFFLPSYSNIISDSIVFLDRVFNISSNYISRKNIEEVRLFSLSDYGSYMFLFKLSIHYTRIQDKVERRSTHI